MALKRRNRISASFNMSSMTDMMFLLLLFFMIASTMSAPNDLRIKLPQSSSTHSTKVVLVKVSIDNEGNYSVAKGNDAPSAILPDQLENVLIDAMAQDTTTFIAMHADEKRPYSENVNVRDIANKNKLKIVLATKPADNE